MINKANIFVGCDAHISRPNGRYDPSCSICVTVALHKLCDVFNDALKEIKKEE